MFIRSRSVPVHPKQPNSRKGVSPRLQCHLQTLVPLDPSTTSCTSIRHVSRQVRPGSVTSTTPKGLFSTAARARRDLWYDQLRCVFVAERASQLVAFGGERLLRKEPRRAVEHAKEMQIYRGSESRNRWILMNRIWALVDGNMASKGSNYRIPDDVAVASLIHSAIIGPGRVATVVVYTFFRSIWSSSRREKETLPTKITTIVLFIRAAPRKRGDGGWKGRMEGREDGDTHQL